MSIAAQAIFNSVANLPPTVFTFNPEPWFGVLTQAVDPVDPACDPALGTCPCDPALGTCPCDSSVDPSCSDYVY